MSKVILKNVNKIYDNKVQAVFDFNLEVNDGEFIVLVGPSGCGKSTVLRMICGLESITSGTLSIDDEIVNKIAPSERRVTMVFQNYALYGNMTVYDNMGFSKTVRKKSDNEIYDSVINAANIVDLIGYLNRFPKQLSGGQKQRVALARSIVSDARIFLLDEPLSNLDAKLRAQTRREITLIHNKLKKTMIYVTHDQIEAMTLADRIVVMKDGYIQQVDTPYNVYKCPVNVFVAQFIGTNPMNIIPCIIENGYALVGNNKLKLTNDQENILKNYNHKEMLLGIRPEDFDIAQSAENSISGDIYTTEFLGNQQTVKFNFNNQIIVSLIDAKYYIKKDEIFVVVPDMNKVHFFDKDTTFAVR